MLFYLDASALVKRFVEETGSAWVVGICNAAAGNVIATGLISRAEVIAALAAKQRNGTLSQTTFETAEQSLTHDFRHRHTVVSVDEALIDHAATLAKSRKLAIASGSVGWAMPISVPVRAVVRWGDG